ncbi:MAG: single-stranded DNA-binding protein [Pseudomonadota bacterium]
MENKEQALVGWIGRNPELAYTASQKAVCTFPLAVLAPTDGEKTIWKKIIVWGEQAEICYGFLKKGRKVFVQGTTQRRKVTDKLGNKSEVEEIEAWEIGVSMMSEFLFRLGGQIDG